MFRRPGLTARRLQRHPVMVLPPSVALAPRSRLRLSRSVRKRGLASKTVGLIRLIRFRPIDLFPIPQREQMVVTSRQMRAQDKSEIACRANGGQAADFAAATGAEITFARGLAVAGAECRSRVYGAGWEAHHKEGALHGAVFRGRMGSCGGSGCAHEEFAVMLLVESDVVGLRGSQGRVGACGNGETDGYLGGEADYLNVHMRGDKFGDGSVDVVRIAGEEGAEKDEDFSCCVGRGMIKPAVCHVEGVLQRRLSLWFILAELLDIGDMVVGVAGERGDVECYAVSHAYDTELRDGVLLEELRDEGGRIAQGKKVSGRPQVLFCHCI